MATDLNISAMEDRLRAMELDISALKRRQPTGTLLPFSAGAYSGGGAMAHEGFYVRINNIVFAWTKHTQPLGNHASPWVNPAPWKVALPFPADFVGGLWWAFKYDINSLYFFGPVQHNPADQFFSMWDVAYSDSVWDLIPFNWATFDGSRLYTFTVSAVTPGY